LKRRLAVLLALAMMFGATAALSGPASAAPLSFVKGNHYGDYRNPDNGEHIGAGVGAGQANNMGLERRGLR
jgi:hypothetical protein